MFNKIRHRKITFDRALDIIKSSNPNIKEKYFKIDNSGANFEKPTINTIFFKIGNEPYFIYEVDYYYNDITLIEILRKNGFKDTVW